jgi:hypothetical protein
MKNKINIGDTIKVKNYYRDGSRYLNVIVRRINKKSITASFADIPSTRLNIKFTAF